MTEATYGSDVVVDLLLRLGVDHLAINPSATLRGLHDTLVNTARGQEMHAVLCCHEEIAAAVAHGYAKAAGKPMAVAVGNIVGLQHVAMGVYNAWSDRVPMILLSGAGPLDAVRRRPHVDWVHATVDQGRIVADVVKWNDQPLSVESLVPSLVRAHRIAMSKPMAPVHLALDTAVQESPVREPVPGLPDGPDTPVRLRPGAGDIEQAAALVAEASRPVILVGRVEHAAEQVIELAELIQAPVVDIGQRLGIPGGHAFDVTDFRPEILRQADLVISLEVKDLHGQLRTTPDPITRRITPLLPAGARIVHIGVDELLLSGYGHFQYQPVDVTVTAEPEEALVDLVAAVASHQRRRVREPWWQDIREAGIAAWQAELTDQWESRPISLPRLGAELGTALGDRPWTLAHNQMGPWPRRLWRWGADSRFLGLLQFAAVGLGYGAGAATGAGVAARGSDRVVVCVDGDGDLLYTPSALWTAANQRVPVLFVVLSNRVYGVDIRHQFAIARGRGRREDQPARGLELADPPVNFSMLARAFGVYADDTVEDPQKLGVALKRALDVIDRGDGPALVEVVTRDE